MNEASSYQEDVLARYGEPSTIKMTQNEQHGWIQVTLESGKRIWLTPMIKWSEMGAKPYIEIAFPDHDNALAS